MTRFAFISLLSLVTACSSGSSHVPDDAASPDSALPCPEGAPDSGSPCSFPGEACVYPSGQPLGRGCFCIGPEKIWMCCDTFECPQYEARSTITVDAPCCPLRAFDSYGCSWCESDNVETKLECSQADPHWRQSQLSCSYASSIGDAGLDAGVSPADAGVPD